MNGWMDGWMAAWMEGWMDGWREGWMDGQAEEGGRTRERKRDKTPNNRETFHETLLACIMHPWHPLAYPGFWNRPEVSNVRTPLGVPWPYLFVRKLGS